MLGRVRGDVSIIAAQVLLEAEGAAGVPGPSTPDQDPGCWDGEVLPPRLSGHHSCAGHSVPLPAVQEKRPQSPFK